MESKRRLVIQEGCPVCAYVKGIIAEKKIDIEIVDASTKEGFDWAKEHGIEKIPMCVIVEPSEEEEKIRECSIAEFKDLLDGKKE